MHKRKVVLIAGSAGSLAPIETIIRTLPTDSGVSFIVLQHLDPDYASRLPELIHNWTSIPCAPVGETSELLADRIFVSSSGELLESKGGHLSLVQSTDAIEKLHAIDALATSLAKDTEVDSALVILSGKGNDGLQGAKAIKASGGLVVAQQPDEATASSMPNAIIRQGLADEVLPAADIAARLNAFAAEAPGDALPGFDPSPAPNEQGLRRIIDLLKRSLRQDFSDYRTGTLTRRLQRRMTMHELTSVDDYIALYGNDTAELQQLCDDFHIGVTSFFRDQAAFDLLRDKLLPELVQSVGEDDEFRAWVIGCSTGEEVYSLAILIEEFFRAHNIRREVKLFATDSDAVALDFARAGVYPVNSLLAMPPDFRTRYFDKRESGFVVRKSIREMVVFATHNVISDTPFSQLDLIICRNLIIYLNDNIKSELLGLFHWALRGKGGLFLGSAESVGRREGDFEPISKKWRLYRRSRKATQKRPLLPMFQNSSELRLAISDAANRPAAITSSEGTLRRIVENNGATQLLVDETNRLLYALGDTGAYLRLPAGEPTGDLLALIQPSLHAPIRALMNRARQKGIAAEAGIPITEGAYRGQALSLTACVIQEPGFNECLVVSISRMGAYEQRATGDEQDQSELTIDLLRQEVDATREDMQRTIQHSRSSEDVLRNANEEIVAMNEELQSSNEELEASKEEMQSLNDELLRTNSQLESHARNIDGLNQDLQNLLASSDSSVLIVDDKMNIQRFTPNIVPLMCLRDTDLGRHVADISRLFEEDGFLTAIELTLSGSTPEDHEVTVKNGRRFIRRIMPYKSASGDIAGAVINFIDITELYRQRLLQKVISDELYWQSKMLDTAAPIIGRTLAGAVTYWNQSAVSLWGYTREDALNENAHKLLKTTFPVETEEAQKTLVEKGQWRGVVTQTTKSGRDIELSASFRLANLPEGGKQLVTEVYQDLSVTMQLRSALKEEQQLFHLLLDWTANAEYWTDAQSNVIYITPAVKDITGFLPADFIEQPRLLESLIDASAKKDWLAHMSADNDIQKNDWRSISLPLNRKDGSKIWIEHRYRAIYSSESEILGYRGTVRDISDLQKLESEAQRLAFNDPLTGLPNRRMLRIKLDEARETGKRSRHYSALVMLDLDHFKRVNDTDGHSVGDALLVEIGRRLRDSLRSADTVSRVGGDEFLLILNTLGRNQLEASLAAIRICTKIKDDISAEQNFPGSTDARLITGSFGIAMFSGNENSGETLMKQADMALYDAKENGRNRIKLFDPEMQANVNQRMAIEQAIIAAKDSGDLMMYYQVQTDSEGMPRASEALLRWRKPDGSITSPNEFMSVLENHPLVNSIGRWVMEQCMDQLKRWESDAALAPLDLSINVSAGYLLSDHFCDDIDSLLRSTGANPRRIILELTENTLLVELDQISETMRQLKTRGLRFSLDDFGTGYSSLSHLRDLPLSQLKIDKSFVDGLPHEEKCKSIVQSILAVGQALHLEVVAEGVETEAQKDFLQALGCDLYQGFYFGHPVAVEAFSFG